MRADLRVAVRALGRAPSFVVACVLSLALGVALNGTIFAFINATVFRPPPFGDPARVVTAQDSRQVPDGYLVSYDEFEAIRTSARSLDGLAAYRAGGSYRYLLHLEQGGIRAAGLAVTGSLFGVLRVHPILGRGLLPEDERPDAAPVVVLGGSLWKRAFDGRRDVVGTTIRIDQRTHTIVGVMPDDFWFPEWRGEFWTALSPAALGFGRDERSLSLVGRVGPGRTLADASAELTALGRRLDAAGDPRSRRWWRISPFAEVIRPGDVHLLTVLQLVAAAVLVLACVNVSNLMLVRLSVRARESAIRTSLGATRWQRLRPFVAEAAVLAGLTGTVGALAALAAIRVAVANMDRAILAQLVAGGVPYVLGFATAAAILAMVLCLAGPAFQLLRGDARLTLKEGTSGTGFSRGVRHLRRAAVGLQIACSVALCASTVLLVRALDVMGGWTPAYPTRGLMVMPLRPPSDRLPTPGATRRLLERMQSIPGVGAAAVAFPVPPGEGRIIADDGSEANECSCELVSVDYLAVVGMRLRHGRAFAPADLGEGAVAALDERLARELWGTTDVVGRRLKLGPEAPWLTVLAVTTATDLSRPPRDPNMPARPGVYVLASADSVTRGTLFVRAAAQGSDATALTAVRAAVHDVDPDLPVASLTTMTAKLDDALRPTRTYARLFGALSALALLLATVGLNGILAYHVVTHSREFAIRAALGATPRRLVGGVVRDAGQLLLIGGAAGLALGFASVRVLASVMLEPGVGDPSGPVAIAAGVVMTAVLVATVRPAFVAGQVSAATTLRE